jgi:hypothetical protein
MKTTIAFAMLIVAFLAFSVCAFGSPPTSTKDKPAAIKQAPSVSVQQVSPIIVQADADRSLASPIERVVLAGEVARAQRIERRVDFDRPASYQEPSLDVETPPNETAFNGYANVRPREQV